MNPIFKKPLKFLKKFFLWLFVLIGLYLATAFVLACIPVNTTDADPKKDIAIYLKTNGVHTDIVLPVKNRVKDWSKDVKYLQTTANDSARRFVAIGWGNKDFYLNTPEWSDLKFSTAFKAAFHMGETAMHTQFYDTLPENNRCVKIEISTMEYQRLTDFIAAGFAKDSLGQTQWIPGYHYTGYDAFYQANGKYDLFHTCNSWTNSALKASGQKAALWALTDSAVLRHYTE